MILDPILDMFRGKAVTIPPLDGAFRPNTRLDDAPAFASADRAGQSAGLGDGRLLASSGNAVYSIAAGSGARALSRPFASPITALALSPSGELAVGLESGKLLIGGQGACRCRPKSAASPRLPMPRTARCGWPMVRPSMRRRSGPPT